jgi:phenylalanyl-tRNA synthetase beta chain
LLGYDRGEQEIEGVLSRLQLQPKKTSEGSWNCQIPTYRRDLEREIDLVEEVARLSGYERIPSLLPGGSIPPSADHDQGDRKTLLRRWLKARGFSEVIHYSFCSPKEIERGLGKSDSGERAFLRLSNPLSEELSVLRPSLVPSLLKCLQRNFFRQNTDLRLFEMRNVYRPGPKDGCEEHLSLSFALTGKRYGRHWAFPRDEVDFYDGRGLVEALWESFRLPAFEIRPSTQAYLHPGKSSELLLQGKPMGDWGVLHPAVANDFELNQPVVIGEILLTTIWKVPEEAPHFRALPKFPSIERDLTVVVPEALAGEAVVQKIRNLKIQNIRRVELFDIYKGKPIEEGKKALTYYIQYQDENRTLTDEEVNEIHTRMVETLKTLLPIEWR